MGGIRKYEMVFTVLTFLEGKVCKKKTDSKREKISSLEHQFTHYKQQNMQVRKPNLSFESSQFSPHQNVPMPLTVQLHMAYQNKGVAWGRSLIHHSHVDIPTSMHIRHFEKRKNKNKKKTHVQPYENYALMKIILHCCMC